MSRADGDGEGRACTCGWTPDPGVCDGTGGCPWPTNGSHCSCAHEPFRPAAPAAEADLRANDVAVEDVREILAAIGLGTHARPYSAHDVVQREVLPALRGLVEQAAEAARLRAVVARVEALIGRWPNDELTATLRRALDGEDPR